MKRSLLLAAAILYLPALSADPAHAQNQRSWVASFGNNANPCTRASPCLTFAGALANTNINGEINCVDAGDFFTVLIDKSITIDCNDVASTSVAAGQIGVSILLPLANPLDPLRTVRLRGLRISGAGLNATVGTRVAAEGIRITSALHVFIEDVLVTQFINQGIRDIRDGSGNLYIRNTVVRDNGGTGIAVVPQSGTVDVVIDNSHVNRSNFGLSAANNSRVVVNDSVFMGNAVHGVHADAGGSLSIDRSVISGNVIGVGADAGSVVELANTDIKFNGTGIVGNTFSFTNNRISRNGSPGTPPTPIGVATSDTGQQ
jgi:Right handed beta helix region